MPTKNDSLVDQLSRSNELTITVTGRKSGRSISNPAWFVVEGNALFLLPVQGSDTQWYKNVLKNPSIQIEAGGAKGEFDADATQDAKQVSAVADKFRAKYRPGDVKKYYSKLDAAVLLHLH